MLAILICAVSLSACSKPVNRSIDADSAESSQSAVDVAVREVLQGYLGALNRGDYDAAAAYWSPTAGVKAADLKIPGASGWSFISSELIDSSATTARVQLNFSVNVTPGAQSTYTSGRNVRYFRLVLEQRTWKIQSMTTSP